MSAPVPPPLYPIFLLRALARPVLIPDMPTAPVPGLVAGYRRRHALLLRGRGPPGTVRDTSKSVFKMQVASTLFSAPVNVYQVYVFSVRLTSHCERCSWDPDDLDEIRSLLLFFGIKLGYLISEKQSYTRSCLVHEPYCSTV